MGLDRSFDVKRKWLAGAALIAVAAGGLAWGNGFWSARSDEPAYRTAKIDRGDIVAGVRATGTLSPVTTVLVGSQLSGQIVEIATDYNAPVKKGQVIARLFSEQIKSRRDAAAADLQQGRADLDQRKAQLERARATRQRSDGALADQMAQKDRVAAQLAEAKRNYERQHELTERGVGSANALEAAKTQLDIQTATLASSEATIAQAQAELIGLDADIALAQAQVASADAVIAARQAKLRDIEIDLNRTDIRSPVDGVVINKEIELGQTVAASLNAPTLFTIAQDLSQIDIYANVDESDVGRIKPDQPVTFTVTAFPERTYRGRVKMVRLQAQTLNNVVTYTGVINVENKDLSLLPGMTANLQVITDERRDVLRLPSAATRFRPAGASPQIASPAAAPREPGERRRRRPPEAGATASLPDAAGTPGRVHVIGDDGQPRAVAVRLGATDGSFVEVVSGLAEGDVVITGGGPRGGTEPAASGGRGPRGPRLF